MLQTRSVQAEHFKKRTHVACRDENQSPTNSIMFEKNPLLLQMGQQLK